MSIQASFIVPHPPLIIPEIGRGEEKKIQKTIDSYDRIAKQISEIKPDTIIVTTPHSVMYSDYIHISPGLKAEGSFREFGHKDISLEAEYDEDLAIEISEEAKSQGIAAGRMGQRTKDLDHGTMIPLYFINKYYNDYRLVRISISGLSLREHYEFGKVIGRVIERSNKRVVFIASGDLSHKLKEEGPYGYTEEGPIFDMKVTETMKTGDLMKLLEYDDKFLYAAAECGLRSFVVMAGALDGKKIKPQLLSYEGPFGVGYAVASYEVLEDDKASKSDEYLELARQTLENYIVNQEIIDIPNKISRELLENRAGVFVSLELAGELRGCIGTISPTTDSIAAEIIQNAISAGSKDPRFPPLTKDELAGLKLSVDVLGDIEEVNSMDELDHKRYGVIVTKGFRRGLLLPNLEGVNSAEQQLFIALEKAGIRPNENYKIERFEVVRHE
ncbi:MAG TPA: AmmeMemoRadiSam system protein A [Tissierellaceae bacterium]|nr:AmmeMemoRadiSam system protein A [Tissierellaceae bacterium]